MKIELHITECTPAELQNLAAYLNDGRRFRLPKQPTKDEVSAAEPTEKPKAVSNTPRRKTCSRPVVGMKGEDKQEWPSVSACAYALHIAISSVHRAIKEDRYTNNGWKLYYKAEEDIQAEAAGEKDPAEIRIPEDTKAPDWSRKPQAIIGVKGKEKKRWESIYQCTRALGSSYQTVRSACLHYGLIDGWMLMFDNETTN